MPDLMGKDEMEAMSLLVEAGLQLGEVTEVAGKVITFTVTASDDAPMPEKESVTNSGEEFTFGKIKFAKVGTFTYTITETATNAGVPGVTTAVLGCDTPQQAAQNCDLFDQTVDLSNDQMEKIHQAFHGIDPRVINPGCWYNHT